MPTYLVKKTWVVVAKDMNDAENRVKKNPSCVELSIERLSDKEYRELMEKI